MCKRCPHSSCFIACICVSLPLVFHLCCSCPADHGENFYKGSLADFKLFLGPLGASDTFHMLTSFPFEFSERSLPVSEQLVVDLPLRANCSSQLPLDTALLAASFSQASKYRVSTPGSSSMGNSYTSSVRNVFSMPEPEGHFFSSEGGKKIGSTVRQLRTQPRSAVLVFHGERDLRRQQQRVALLHLAGEPRVEALNLGDGQLSVMLTVAETKLAFIQYLRETGAEVNRVGA